MQFLGWLQMALRLIRQFKQYFPSTNHMKPFLILVLAITLTGCSDAYDCGPDWEPPYMGPQGAPIPGYPHGNDPDDPGKWGRLTPEGYQQMSDEDKALLRRQCGC